MSPESPLLSRPATGVRPPPRLSALDESLILGRHLTLLAADNATVTLEDADGGSRPYTDLTSVYGAVNFGHCNPDIEAFRGLRADLAVGCMTPDAEAFARWLCDRLALADHRVLFQVGGSFAVTTALAMAQRARPGRVAVLRGSFHGLGLDALAATTVGGETALQSTPLGGSLRSLFQPLQPPGRGAPATDPEAVDWGSYSAFLFEPVQGANGYVPVDAEWLRAAVESARAAGVAVIADEIQAGYFRHGALSPSRAAGLPADILLFSKSMTNGLYPSSVVVYDPRFEAGMGDGPRLAHTFQTSALGSSAANAVAGWIERTDVGGLAERVEGALRRCSQDLVGIAGVEDVFLTGPTLSFGLPAGGAAAIVQGCVARGVIPFTGGAAGERVRIAPPLTIEEGELRRALDVVVETVGAPGMRSAQSNGKEE